MFGGLLVNNLKCKIFCMRCCSSVLCFSPVFALPLFLKVDVLWLFLPLVWLGLELKRERWESW